MERYVYFIGDSHTAGVGDPDGLGWVGRVVSASFAAGIPLTAYNLGVRGDTSQDGAARWPEEVARRLPEEGDLRVVLAFGVNDTTLVDGALRAPAEETLAAFESMLDQAAAMGMRPFVVGPAAVDDEEQNERIATLTDELIALCARRGVTCVPVLGRLRELPAWRSQVAASDGAHPEAEGYAALGGAVFDSGWLEWLRS